MTSSLRNDSSRPPPSVAAKSGLTVSKVIAGAGAAATTAVAGSVFGADGTVVGAAVGSVVSAVAAAVYERSFDQTRQVVVARVRPRGSQDAEVTQVMATQVVATDVTVAEVTQVIPAQRPALGAPTTGSVAPASRVRRTRLPLLAGATVVIFAMGLLLVTGIELFAGGPVLSGNQGGTSVGTLLHDDPGSRSAPTTTEAAPTTSATGSAAPTASSSLSPTKRSGSDARPSGRPAADGSATPSATPAPRGNGAPAATSAE
jgi:hypothetical protein